MLSSNLPKRLHGWKWEKYWKLLAARVTCARGWVSVQRDWSQSPRVEAGETGKKCIS